MRDHWGRERAIYRPQMTQCECCKGFFVLEDRARKYCTVECRRMVERRTRRAMKPLTVGQNERIRKYWQQRANEILGPQERTA